MRGLSPEQAAAAAAARRGRFGGRFGAAHRASAAATATAVAVAATAAVPSAPTPPTAAADTSTRKDDNNDKAAGAADTSVHDDDIISSEEKRQQEGDVLSPQQSTARRGSFSGTAHRASAVVATAKATAYTSAHGDDGSCSSSGEERQQEEADNDSDYNDGEEDEENTTNSTNEDEVDDDYRDGRGDAMEEKDDGFSDDNHGDDGGGDTMDEDGDDDDDASGADGRGDNGNYGDGGGQTNDSAAVRATTMTATTTMVSEAFPARFASWEELDDYIEELGASTYQLFFKRSSMSVGHRHMMVEKSKRKKGRAIDKANDPDFTPFEWVYYSRVYACTCGSRNSRRGQGLRNHIVVRGTGCKAKINAKVHYDPRLGVHYIKTTLKGVHNHPCDRERYYSYAENRKFEPELLHEMAALRERGCRGREILNYAAQYVWNRTGMKSVYKISDVRNALRRYMKRNGDTANGETDEATSEANAERNDDEAEARRSGQDQELAGHHRQRQVRGAAHDGIPVNQFSEDEPEPGSYQSTGAHHRRMQSEAGTRESGDHANRRKRRSTAITPDDAPSTLDEPTIHVATPRPLQKVMLSQFEVLVNAPYSYALAQEEMSLLALASPLRAPQTISGFSCEVFVLPPHFKPKELDFVLPRYATTGCERAIIEACRARSLLPPALGVKLIIQKPHSELNVMVQLTSRQLVTMKKIHVARQHMLDTKKSLAWIANADFPSSRPAAPFDDVFDCSKDNLSRSLRFMPLSTTVVRGTVSNPNSPPFGFTDTVSGASIPKFASTSNLDIDCMKAVLLHMHSRFHAEAAMVCPNFLHVESSSSTDPHKRFRQANAYGAFTTLKLCVMGVMQLKSKRWSSFFYDCSRKKCFLFQSVEAEFDEHREKVHGLLCGFDLKATTFACSANPTPRPVSISDSGILALLFLELFVLKKPWDELLLSDLAYYRIRYMMQSIQVVNNQDLNEIRAL